MLDMGFEPEVRSILSSTCSGMLQNVSLLISYFYRLTSATIIFAVVLSS